MYFSPNSTSYVKFLDSLERKKIMMLLLLMMTTMMIKMIIMKNGEI